MASQINEQIGRQAFELIHDRIGEILADELGYQGHYNEDCRVKVYKERDVPYSPGETPAVNVMLDRGEFDLRTIEEHHGIYRYLIQATRQGKGDGNSLGDTIAMTKLQRLMGVIRAILMSPKYVRLGFTPPFIEQRFVENISFGKPVRQDSSHTVMGNITFAVKVFESVDFDQVTIATGYHTGVLLAETELGYQYIAYN